MQKKEKNLEAIAPFSPIQQGFLFHSLYAPQSGTYLIQLSCTIRGDFDRSVFERTWNQVVERHSILRTLFVWDRLEQPIQVVRRQVKVPMQYTDWRHLTPDVQQATFDSWLAKDRKQDFDLARPPLMRLSLFQIAADSWYFVWTCHHLLMDGWSQSLLLKEVLTIYAALLEGQAVHLPQPRPFHEYTTWLGRQDLAAAEKFWRTTLAGFQEPTPLVMQRDADGSPTNGEDYIQQSVVLPEAVVAQLQTLGHTHRLTLNTLVQGAWALILSRYSGEADVVFGTVVSGRPPELPDVEVMIGPFINTLPVRLVVEENAQTLSWLEQIQQQQLEHRQYEYASLLQIQGWSEVPSGTPLFHSLMIFENYLISQVTQEQRHILAIEAVRSFERSNYPLTLVVLPGKEMKLSLYYEPRHFDDATVERLLGHLQMILMAIADNVERPVSTLPLLHKAEQQQILVDWNNTYEPRWLNGLLHERFESQAASTPDAIAVVFNDQQFTYHDLNARANQVAHTLRDLGVEPEVYVGIHVHRSVEMIVGLLGILKAGGAYVPLDPAYPADHLAFIMADTQMSVLLTQDHLRAQMGLHQAQVLCLDSDWPHIAEASTANLDCPIDRENLAYVMYTSGSTGRPKGVMISHRGLYNLSQVQIRHFGLTASDRILQFASFSFDAAIWDIIMALLSGARLYLADTETLLPNAELIAFLHDHAITTATLPPAVLALLPDAELPCLRTIISAGEACPSAIVERWSVGRSFFNAYGPTEATVCATISDALDGHLQPPIGHPIANMQVYILDKHLNPVPVGAYGEIYISGVGIARGYLNRPDLTAERFIPNPFDTPERVSGRGRLYRSGDVARYRPDGTVDYLGRRDYQVKLRGFRIELGQIETVLRDLPDVREAVVQLREDVPGDKRLVAYVVPGTGNKQSAEATHKAVTAHTDAADAQPDDLISQLRMHLKTQLPEYMMPSAFVLLDTLPLTTNGKLDRQALPTPDQVRSEDDSAPVAPRTPLEARLDAIWREVLGRERISVHDNFFALGGHSLLATQVVARIREQLDRALSLPQFFAAPTIAALAAHLAQADCPPVAAPPPLLPVPRDRPLPLSFAQQRLWFLHQLAPTSPAYHTPLLVRLTGSLDHAALAHSLALVVARHEVLRTTFITTAGQPLQQIHPPAPVPLPRLDLTALPADQRDAAARDHVRAAVRQPFDLHAGPLLRAQLLQLQPDTQLLLLVLHHISIDGWSLNLLLRDLVAAYRSTVTGQPLALPPVSLQYADYAVWQRHWLHGPVLEQQLRYWRQQLAPLPVLDLPTDYPRPPVQSFHGATTTRLLPASLRDRLHALSRQAEVTLFMTLLAAWQLLLSRISGQADIAVGTPIANRQQVGLEPLIGFFVNTLVLRTDLSGGPSVRTLLDRVRTTTLAAYAHQDVPFEQVVEAVQPVRDRSRQPLFQVMFVLQNTPLATVELPELRLEPVALEVDTALFDLTLAITETADGLAAALEYNRDLFTPSTAARLLQQYQTVLAACCAQPEQPVATLPLLSTAERQQLVRDWNATTMASPEAGSLPELFAAQVAAQPDADALIWGDETLSYAALNARANQLAHHLRRSGVVSGVRVGVCMERSRDALIALLGILKAGGTFVPLDPTYPLSRLVYMLADSQTALLLTNADSQAIVRPLVAQAPSGLHSLIALDHTPRPADLTATIAFTNAADIARAPTNQPSNQSSADDLVYIMYTSGSTGEPKGVPIDHHNLVSFFQWNQRYFEFGPDDRIIQFHNLSFDFSTWEIFEAWLAGASLHVVAASVARDVEALADYLMAERITVLNMTPSQFQALAEHVESAAPQALASLRTVVLGGEMLTAALAERALAILPQDCRLYNEYGPTEATISCAIRQVTPQLVAEAERSYSVAFGWPIANTQLYVLDRQLQPTPVSVPGELYIGGAGLARYYLNRPDLTAERFVPNPFAEETHGASGTRLYKTGDLVRYRIDGSLEFLGRIDQQVKLRGYRIELSEIEAVLRQHPAIADAVVITREDTADTRLVAYVTEEQGNKAGAFWAKEHSADLRAFLQERLPSYMIPAAFVVLDQVPLTPNGKVDRKALPVPDSGTIARSAGFVAPRTDEEAALAQIWAQVLQLDRVSVHDNFFELGGHSLLAVRLMSAIREWNGQPLPLSSLFQAPTIAQLAAQLRRDTAERSWTPLVTLQPQGSQAPFFCIHPVGGTVFCYTELARSLGTNRPFYALQARGLEPDQTPIDDIPALAAQYLRSIQAVQPQGPYLLGGWSLGGTIAFELARQLQAQGEQIELLALIDSSPAITNHATADDLDPATVLADFIDDLSRLFGKALPIDVSALRQLEPAAREGYILAQAREQGVIPPDIGEDQLRRLARVFQAHMQAFQRYQPSPVAVRVELVQASASLDSAHADSLGEWRRLALGRVAAHTVPGDHFTLLQQPHVGAVAEWLRARLDDQARQPS